MHHLSKQNSQDHQHPGWKTLKPISCNASEVIGDTKHTKNPTDENWGTNRKSRNKIKKAIKEKKTQFYRKVLSSKYSKEI